MGIGPNSPIQQDLFDINAEQFEKMKRLDAVIDRINKVNGTETIVLGSQQYTQKEKLTSLPMPSSMISKVRTQRLAGVILLY